MLIALFMFVECVSALTEYISEPPSVPLLILSTYWTASSSSESGYMRRNDTRAPKQPRQRYQPPADYSDGMRRIVKTEGVEFDCEDGIAEVISCGKGRRFAYVPETVSANGETFKVRSVGDFAFSASMVEEVVLPPSLRRICREAFKGCRRLQTVTMPVANVDPTAFEGCRALDSVVIIDGDSLTGYLGRISKPGKTPEYFLGGRGTYFPLTGSMDKMTNDSLPERSLYDYVDCGGMKRHSELVSRKKGSEQEAADCLALMAALSEPAESDRDVAEAVMADGSPFCRAMALACGIDGAVDIKGARDILVEGPNGRLYRKLSDDPFMVGLRGLVKDRTDDTLRKAMDAYRTSETLAEMTASLYAVRICLDRDMGLERLLSAIDACEGSLELEFAVYDRIVPVLGTIAGCASAGPEDKEM